MLKYASLYVANPVFLNFFIILIPNLGMKKQTLLMLRNYRYDLKFVSLNHLLR